MRDAAPPVLCTSPDGASWAALSDPLRRARKIRAQFSTRGTVHCDLKPDNVLVTSDGRAVITDFGIAREIAPSDALLELDRSAGTPEYIAPEQVIEAPTFDGRVDLYAMGVLLYELLTGALPFVGTTPLLTAAARLMRSPPDPRERRPDLSIWWAKAVLRCLARNPDERYQSATELTRALQSLPLC